VTTRNKLGRKIRWVEMPSNWEEKEAMKAKKEMGRCDEAEQNNQPKVSAGNNESGEVCLAITMEKDQRSKPVDPRKDEPDGRTMEEPASLVPFLPL